MSKRNEIQTANKLLVSLIDKYPHYLIQCFSYKGEEMEVSTVSTFNEAELEEIFKSVEEADDDQNNET